MKLLDDGEAIEEGRKQKCQNKVTTTDVTKIDEEKQMHWHSLISVFPFSFSQLCRMEKYTTWFLLI